MHKRIAIAGLGIEGISTIKYLQKNNLQVTVFDEKLTEKSDALAELKRKQIPYVLGEGVLQRLEDFDVIFRSPGISARRPEILNAKKKGAVVTSHTKLFFELCPCPIIGVTGTKGKGTTSTLIYEMLKHQGFDVFLGGNIGTPPLDFLDTVQASSQVVLELSSFQLMDLSRSPHIAVILMITSEHLDVHTDVEEYIDAKRNIVKFQQNNDMAVINRDYIASHESDIHTGGQIFQVSIERSCEQGCFIKDGHVVIRASSFLFSSDKSTNNSNSANGTRIQANKASLDTTEQQIIATDNILLPGKHNLENVCAASMAAFLAGAHKQAIRETLKSFKGLEHRLQLVRELQGVRYYDDSFSTTPETAVAAIEAFKNPEILILGGSSKNSDFTLLGKTIRLARNIKAIIGIGTEWERIRSEIINDKDRDAIHVEDILLIEGATTMQQIVQAANKIAQSGDIVLLSPACASYDMFKNYKERGAQFQSEVNKLE